MLSPPGRAQDSRPLARPQIQVEFALERWGNAFADCSPATGWQQGTDGTLLILFGMQDMTFGPILQPRTGCIFQCRSAGRG
jgi:hypothetical protein